MPSPTHASCSASTPVPRRTSNKPDWTITSDEVEQGRILWLGTLEETFASQARRGHRLESVMNVKTGQAANLGMFEHPILAISRPLSDPSKLYFLPMTSLGGKSLQQRYHGRKSSYHQATFLPITPAAEHPHHINGDVRYRTLTLENGDMLERSTFVNIRELYVMDWQDVQLYWGSNPTLRKAWRLDRDSIRSVVRLATTCAGFQAEPQFRPRQQTPPRRVTPLSPVPPVLSPAITGLGIEIPRRIDSPIEACKSSSAPAVGPEPSSVPTTPSTKRGSSHSGVRLPPIPVIPFHPYDQGEPTFPVFVAPSPMVMTARTTDRESNTYAPTAYTRRSDPIEEQRVPLLTRGTDDLSPLSRQSSGASSYHGRGFCCPPCIEFFAFVRGRWAF